MYNIRKMLLDIWNEFILEVSLSRIYALNILFLTVGPSYIAQAGSLGTPTLIALIVSGAVFLLFAALLLLFCRCRRKHATKAKDYEMDTNA